MYMFMYGVFLEPNLRGSEGGWSKINQFEISGVNVIMKVTIIFRGYIYYLFVYLIN